jgi:aminopeptidase N
LDGFVDARILVASVDKDNNETLEIAHEALLRTWPTLISWLVEDRDKLRQYNAIVRAAKDWDEGDRKTDLLIHRDGRLKDAVELTSERRFTFLPGLVEHTYLTACVTDQKAREAAAQAERDRRLKDAERLLEEEAKRARAEAGRAAEAEKAQRLEKERAKEAEKYAEEQKQVAQKLRRRAFATAGAAGIDSCYDLPFNVVIVFLTRQMF